MERFLITRLASAAIVVFGVTSLVFFLIHLIPGDPVEVMLGESARVTDRENLRHALGLDRPLLAQWLDYLYHTIRFELGESLHSRQPIIDILKVRIPATLELTLVA